MSQVVLRSSANSAADRGGESRDIREAMRARCPAFLQPILTAITGKPPRGAQPARKRRRVVVVGCYLIQLFAGIALGASSALRSELVWLLPFAWAMALHGGRALQLQPYHLAAHGTAVGPGGRRWRSTNELLGRALAVLLAIQEFGAYRLRHVRDHHPSWVLSTDIDPTVQHLRGIPLREGDSVALSVRNVLVSFVNPLRLARRAFDRVSSHFHGTSPGYRVACLAVWGGLGAACYALGSWIGVLLGWLFPLFVLHEASTSLRLCVEHNSPARQPPRSRREAAELTTAVFCGSMPPAAGAGSLAWLRWTGAMLGHALERYLILVADTPQHDLHHLKPQSIEWANATWEREKEARLHPELYSESWGLLRTIGRRLELLAASPGGGPESPNGQARRSAAVRGVPSGAEARAGAGTACSFEDYLARQRAAGVLVVQPRMGFSDLSEMRAGLSAVATFEGARIGTLTVDAFTRQGMEERAREALARGERLNGFPLTSYDARATAELVEAAARADLCVQVRHGSPRPERILAAAARAGIDATEGGPVSYCLPYGRVPLAESVQAWRRAGNLWARHAEALGRPTHMEVFGGSNLGQLCPPSLLVALSLLEARFFVECGVPRVSLSLAQGTNPVQDVGALLALRELAAPYLWSTPHHVVSYTFMGVFPETAAGARRLIEESARVARLGGAARLIVKTAAEAHGIPTVQDNVEAMGWAARASRVVEGAAPSSAAQSYAREIAEEASALVDACLVLADDVGEALVRAFAAGTLEVPYCLHPDNAGRARAAIDPETGVIEWAYTGALATGGRTSRGGVLPSSTALLKSLEYNRKKYDGGRS